MSITVNTSELKRLNRSMKKVGGNFEKASNRLLKKLGVWVHGKSRDLCPESPTVAQYAAANKSGKTARNRTAITTGSLRDSITMQAGTNRVDIFIPANSRGGKYGEKMHDEKGRTWKKLGPRSRQKNATDKFIFKAYDESKSIQSELVDDVIDEITRGIGI